MIRAALDYPRTDENWTTTVLIGGLLGLLGVLVVPAFLVSGYLVRVLGRTMRGDDRPPVFEAWTDLLVDGLKAFVIAFAYGVVPGVIAIAVAFGVALPFTVVGGASAGGVVESGTAVRTGVGLAVAAIALVGGLLALVAGVLAAYVVPAATAAFAETGRLGAAFSVGRLRPVLTSGTYATAWVSAAAIVVGAGLVAGALNAIPVIGFVIGGFVGFYAAVAAYYLVGHAWGEFHGTDLGDAGPDDAPTGRSTPRSPDT